MDKQKREKEKNCDKVAVTGEECLHLNLPIEFQRETTEKNNDTETDHDFDATWLYDRWLPSSRQHLHNMTL